MIELYRTGKATDTANIPAGEQSLFVPTFEECEEYIGPGCFFFSNQFLKKVDCVWTSIRKTSDCQASVLALD